MRNYAVIGDPVEHSRSPGMQNAAFEFHHLGSPYGKYHVRPAELGKFVESARRELAGFNCTVPHKAAIIPFLDEVDPDALAAESVNTVTVDEIEILDAIEIIPCTDKSIKSIEGVGVWAR